MSTNAFPMTGYPVASNPSDYFSSSFLDQFRRKPKLPYDPRTDTQVGRLANLQDADVLRREGAYSFLYPQLQSLVSDPGYSKEEESAIMQESLGAAGTGFNTARERARNLVARSGNRAGYGSLIGSLARDEARAKSGITRQNMIAFADERFRRKQAGLQGLMQLYGIDTSFLDSLLRQATSIQALREGKDKAGSLGGVITGLLGGFGNVLKSD